MVQHAWRVAILGDPKDVHVRRWSAGLASRGLEVTIVCGQLPRARVPNVEYHPLQVPGPGLGRPLRAAARHRAYLRALFSRFDIVHMHNVHHWGIDESVVEGARFVVSAYGGDVLPNCLPGEETRCPIDRHPHTAGMKRLA